MLADLDESAPEALATVSAHPYTRVWVSHCLEELQRGGDVSAEFDNINNLAIAAACHAGHTAELTLTVRDGAVHLPTLGAAPAPGRRTVRVSTEDGALTFGEGADAFRVDVHAPAEHADEARWQPVRILAASGYRVRLEDTDPYRDCHTIGEEWQVEHRLSADAVYRWQETFADAVALIDDDLPAYAEGLRAGLSTLMPLAPRPGRAGYISAAARRAFGAVGAALPDTPAMLALLLVHEFQHVKLGAVLDMFDLFDKNDTAHRYYAPWRPDLRPFEGLFQGTYAHIGVTDYWRVRRRRDPGTDAEAQFARWRDQTAEAVEMLLKSGSLTPLGIEFVEAMRATVMPWCDEPVSKEALEAAQRASAEHRAAYDVRTP